MNEANDIMTEAKLHASDKNNGYSTYQKESGILNRGQFRQYQINMLYKQIQIELFVSILLGTGVCTVFWGLAPQAILLFWAISVISLVGVRSLFIYHRSDDDKP